MSILRLACRFLLLVQFTVHLPAQSVDAPQPALLTSPGATADESNPAETNKPSPSVLLPTRITSTVRVSARVPVLSIDLNSPPPLRATPREILPSAGTYGDFSRYLQLYPGVVFSNDESDNILVRGGNPIENLYLVDGFEVPNLNHIAVTGNTGGLVSMIDTAAIDDIEFRTGGYNASYPERLSSIVEIHTLTSEDRSRHAQMEIGFVGAGATVLQPLGEKASLLLSSHRSLLNLFTDDIGLDGVPIYTNALAVLRVNPSASDEISILSLGGEDSIDITPDERNAWETITINTQYTGWRNTTGLRWRHVFSPRWYGVAALTNSELATSISQQDQYLNNLIPPGPVRPPVVPTPVYSEVSRDGSTSLKLDFAYTSGSRFQLMTGTSATMRRIHYQVAQPLGMQSPLSPDPARSDAASFYPHFISGESGSYFEATANLGRRLSVSGGSRLQTFSLGGYVTVTPRASTVFRMSRIIGLYGSFGDMRRCRR